MRLDINKLPTFLNHYERIAGSKYDEDFYNSLEVLIDFEETTTEFKPLLRFKLKDTLNNKIFANLNINNYKYECRLCMDSYYYGTHCEHLCLCNRFLREYVKRNPNFFDQVENKLELPKRKFDEKQEFIRKEEERNEAIAKNRLLVEKIKKFDILPLAIKNSIECNVTIIESEVSLVLRVGTDKKFKIQSVYEFLNNFENRRFAFYGKKYGFVHCPSSFDELALKIIAFIATISRDINKNIILNKWQFDELLKIMKGSYINIETINFKRPFFVSLEEKEVNLNLDSNFTLSLPADHFVYSGPVHDYYFTDTTIYKIVYPNEGFKVLMSEINSLTFIHSKNIFEKEIYPRYSNYIEVPEEIKNQIELSSFSIKSYFDLETNNLTVISKYFLNEDEVGEEVLKNNYFNFKLYKNYLENLGFVNNVCDDIKKISAFLRTDLSYLKGVSEIFLSDKILNMKIKRFSGARTGLSYDVGILNIFFEESSYSDEELNLIIKSLRKKVNYIKLNKDTIIEVDEETSEKLLNTIDEFKLDITKLTKPQQIPLYQSLKLQDNYVNIVDFSIDENIKSLLNEIKNYKNLSYELPNHLVDIMRDYQKEAFNWMSTLCKYEFAGILADDMGLGKTLEVISVIHSNKEEKPSLIVCPKTLCYNWKNEFTMWANDLDVAIIIGSPQERKDIIDNIEPNKNVIYIISYDSLRNDVELFLHKKFKFLILDEAQTIKNHATLKSQSVKLLKAKYRFVLTGTPIENTVMDLWSLFDFLLPNYLGAHNDFKKNYERAIALHKNEDIIKRLVYKITPFVLRRTKEEVLSDLPSKVETIQIASMEKEQRKLYEAQLKKTKDLILSDPKNKILILSQLTRLRQICVDPSLFVEDYKGDSAKIDLLMELIDEYTLEGHKIIVFSQFVQIFEKISKLLEEKDLKYFTITGKTDALERVERANAFNDVSSAEKVFLVSLKAGGTGLNLVGADIVIILDPWWNYAAESQATDRAHRIGQTRSVNVIKLISENSIEQKVIELQILKKEIADRIISSDDSSLENVKIDDIRYLFDN